MVVLILTEAGFGQLDTLGTGSDTVVWLNSGVADAESIARLRTEGWEVTTITRWIDPLDSDGVSSMVETIREHHPGRAVFVEHAESAIRP